MEMNAIIETERLYLRPIVMSDSNDIYEYAKEPNVGPNAGWKPHESMEETLQIMESVFMNEDNIFGIILRESNKLIGSIGLVKDPKREYERAKMLGYAIGEAYWGRGYMTEAAKALIEHSFKTMDIDLISAYCYPFNERSKNVIKKLGFKYEGTLSLCVKLYSGKVYDNDCYALRPEQ